MSTQWKKLSQEQPKEGEPVWLYKLTSATGSIHYLQSYSPLLKMEEMQFWYWMPAPQAPAPPDGSEAAFEEWWKTNRDAQSWKESAQGAWNAALAWHKNKTKERA